MSDNEIIEALGLTGLDDAAKQQTLDQVEFIVAARVGGILEAAMDDEQLEHFKQLQNGPREEVWAWLNTTFVNTSELKDEVLGDYIREYSDRLSTL